METNVQIFNSEQFGQLTTIITNEGKMLFKANDVAKTLGYTQPAVAIIKHCKGVTVLETPSAGGPQQTKFIGESDLYRLVMRSKLPEAEKFQDWVVEDVLPTIRKHGAYMTDTVLKEALTNPDFGIQLLTELKNERQARLELQAKAAQQQTVIAEQKMQIADMKEKSLYCEMVLSSRSLVKVTDSAQDYGTTAEAFNAYLEMLHIQYRHKPPQDMPNAKKKGQWILYEPWKSKGYVHSETFPHKHKDGTIETQRLTKWTQEGCLFLYQELKKHKALPVVEWTDDYQMPYDLMSYAAKQEYDKRQKQIAK